MRQSERAAATRAALLTAAREVFAESGFSDAGITDVVGRAGASVGSLYHHFGGKADLYLALFEDFQDRQEAQATQAVSDARASGVTEPITLFLAGSAAFLDACWDERDLARLFLTGEGPPGFELVTRRRYREWVRLNESLLGSLDEGDDGVSLEVLVMVLTSIVSEAGSEIALSDSRERADRIAADVLTLIERVAARPGG